MSETAMRSDPSIPAPREKFASHGDMLAQHRSLGKRKHTGDGNEEAARDALAELAGNSRIGRGNNTPSRASSEAPSLSSYLQTPALARSVKKRRLDEKPADPDAVVPPYRAFPNGSQRGLAFVGTTTTPSAPPATAPAAVIRSQNSLGVSEAPTSELPTSYSLSDITSESSRARISNSQRSAKAPQGLREGESSSSGKVDASTVSPSTGGHSVGRDEEIAVLASGPFANLGIEKQVIVVADDTQEKTGDAAILSNAIPSEVYKKTATVTKANANPLPTHKQCAPSNLLPEATPAARSDVLQKLHGLSTTICPPEPVTSANKFKTHLTPGLSALSSNAATSDRYQPVSIARELCPQERGYWLLDSSIWSLETQVIFWEFMERAIGSGSLGWGVWCTRENDSQKKSQTEGEGKMHALGPLRVYCWGQVVREVWLLLYVASRSQARKVGMSWIDAEGKVVVQMKRA